MSIRVRSENMDDVSDESRDGILNEITRTVHKRGVDGTGFRTECGATRRLAPDDLRRVPIERAVTDADVDKCGRCFRGAGGY